MSINQTRVSPYGIESDTLGVGPTTGNSGKIGGISSYSSPSVPVRDDNCTVPVPLNAAETLRLRHMYLNTAYTRKSNEQFKEMLFSYGWDAYMGEDKSNILTNWFNEHLMFPYWLPELRKIHDWLLQFGIAPYKIVEKEIVVLKKPKTISKKQKTTKKGDVEEEEEEKEENGDKKNKKQRVSFESKSAGKSNFLGKKVISDMEDVFSSYEHHDTEDSVKNSKKDTKIKEEEKKSKLKTRVEIHRVIRTMSFDDGFISTYKDENNDQKFVWTWYPEALPPKFQNQNDYSDYEVMFIVKDPPTMKGFYTNPLKGCIQDWLRLNSRKKMDSINMRHHLNPLVFVEKQPDPATKNPSLIDEMAVSYSSAFNRGELFEHSKALGYGNNNNGKSGGIDPMGINKESGEIELAYGRSLTIDSTCIDGSIDIGLNPQNGFKIEKPDYASIMSTMKFNRGLGGTPDGERLDSKEYSFGGLSSDKVDTDLIGNLNTYGGDPTLINPMSGVGYRVKKLKEGEKIIELKNKELDVYLSTASIEQQEYLLDVKLCSISEYPLALLNIDSNGSKRNGKTQGAKGATMSGASSSKGSSKDSSSSSNDNNLSLKVSVIQTLISYKLFYENHIKKLFMQCYSPSFEKSQLKLLNKLDENSWYIMDKVYSISINLLINPPIIDTNTMTDGYANGFVTPQEVIKNGRQNYGLSLDILNDKKFMSEAIKKLETRYDIEAQLKLQKKYEPKPESKENKPQKKSGDKSSKSDSSSKKRKASTQKSDNKEQKSSKKQKK